MITISEVKKFLKEIYSSSEELTKKQARFNHLLEILIEDFSKYGDGRVRGILAEMKGFTKYMIEESKKKA